MNKELFVKYHFNQVIALGIITIAVVAGQVIMEDTVLFARQPQGVVKGQATQNQSGFLNDEKNKALIDYQNRVKNIVSDYLDQRANFDKPHQSWLFLINKVRYDLLRLTVPDEYKELQIKLISMLDLEYQAVAESGETDNVEINQKWQRLLNQYFWLND